VESGRGGKEGGKSEEPGAGKAVPGLISSGILLRENPSSRILASVKSAFASENEQP
jgi:hypothetical protein